MAETRAGPLGRIIELRIIEGGNQVEDQNKAAMENTPPPDDQEITQELSKEELDGVAGGGDSSAPIVGPHR